MSSSSSTSSSREETSNNSENNGTKSTSSPKDDTYDDLAAELEERLKVIETAEEKQVPSQSPKNKERASVEEVAVLVEEEEEEVEVPETLRQIADLIRSVENILVLTGAGVSCLVIEQCAARGEQWYTQFVLVQYVQYYFIVSLILLSHLPYTGECECGYSRFSYTGDGIVRQFAKVQLAVR